MRELRFQVTGLSEDEARGERRSEGASAQRVAGWALIGIAVLSLFGVSKLTGRVEIISPVSGTTTIADQIAISGRSTDTGADTVTLSVTGSQPQTFPAPEGVFRAQVPLAPGENIISAFANGYSSVPITIIRRLQPVVKINSPSANTATTQNQIEVNGVVENSVGNDLTLDVNGATLHPALTGDRFFATVPLLVGRNIIQALLPEASPAVVEVSRLETGIAITSPADGLTTEQETVTVTGTVENIEAATVTLKLNQSRQSVAVQNGGFTAEVVLRVGENRMQASVGDSLSNEIVVNRTLPPVIITLTSPGSGSTQSSVASVRGTIQNARSTGVTVTASGFRRVVPVNAGNFAVEVPLEIGSNVIRASQGDAVSNEVVVTRLEPPALIGITSPKSGSTQSTSVQVVGTIVNPRGRSVTLTVNGSVRNLPITNGGFAAEVALAIGDNHIRASQGDAASDEVVVSRLATPTIIKITSPQNGRTQSSSVRVTGTIANPQGGSLTLTVNGSGRAVRIMNNAFSSDVQLGVGENRIRASQPGAISNEVVINRISSPTSIEITSPRSGRTRDSSVSVTGSIANPQDRTVTLTVNGSSRTLKIANDSFSSDVELEVGENRIQASQGDSQSNVVIVRRLAPAPTIKIISPQSGRTRESIVTVTGRVENAGDNAVRLTINGSPSGVRVTNGSFSADVRLNPGSNVIVASIGRASDQITLVRPGGRIVIFSPKDGTTTTTRALVVTGRVENVETGTITLTVNGNAFRVQARLPDFQSRVTLSPGNNVIRASLDNATSAEVTVTLQVRDQPGNTSDECSKINCDCNNLRSPITLSETWRRVVTGIEPPTFFTSSAGSSPQDRKAVCRAAEELLRRRCKAAGKVSGTCPPNASGPNAWPRAR